MVNQQDSASGGNKNQVTNNSYSSSNNNNKMSLQFHSDIEQVFVEILGLNKGVVGSFYPTALDG